MKKTIKLLSVLVVTGIFLMTSSSVAATTIGELLSQLAALQAQINALQNRDPVSTAPYIFPKISANKLLIPFTIKIINAPLRAHSSYTKCFIVW